MSIFKGYIKTKQRQYKRDLNNIVGEGEKTNEDYKKSLAEAVKPEFALIPIRLGLKLISYPLKAPLRAVNLFLGMLKYAHAKSDREITFAESFKESLNCNEEALQERYTRYATSTCLCFFALIAQIAVLAYYTSKIVNSSQLVPFDLMLYLFIFIPLFLATFSLYYKNGVRTYQIKKRDFLEPGFFKRLVFIKKLDDAFPTPS
ncbi:hypothetical protein E1N66_20100, partial [Pantoea allii]